MSLLTWKLLGLVSVYFYTKGLNSCKKNFVCGKNKYKEAQFYKFIGTLQTDFVFFSVQRGLIPHITQIAAQDMASGEKFSCYIKPLIPISAEAQKVTGVSWNGTAMTVKGLHVDAFPIEEALCKFLEFLKKFDSVILVAHNGRVFDFRVLSYAVLSIRNL